MNQPKQERPKPNWVIIRDFTDKETGLTIRLSHSVGFRNIYSQEIGRMNKDNKFIRHFPVFSSVHHAKVTVEKFPIAKLATLLAEMEEYVYGMKQAREDEIIVKKQSREMQQLNRDKPKQQAGLKTLSKRDAVMRDVREAVKEAVKETVTPADAGINAPDGVVG